MGTFFFFILIGLVVGYRIDCKRGGVQPWGLLVGLILGLLVGLGTAFFGGSFVKKEIVLEKYNIFPMITNGKNVAAINLSGDNWYLLPVKKGEEEILKKEFISEKNIFFIDSEQRYVEIKIRKACNEKMWLLFFYGGTGIIETKVVLQKGDVVLKTSH